MLGDGVTPDRRLPLVYDMFGSLEKAAGLGEAQVLEWLLNMTMEAGSCTVVPKDGAELRSIYVINRSNVAEGSWNVFMVNPGHIRLCGCFFFVLPASAHAVVVFCHFNLRRTAGFIITHDTASSIRR